MKNVLYAFLLILVLGASGCRCADPPDVGPVDDEATAAAVVASENPVDAVRSGMHGRERGPS